MDKLIKRKKGIDKAKEKARGLGIQYKFSVPLVSVLTRSGGSEEKLVEATGMTKRELQKHNMALADEARDIVWSALEALLPEETEAYLKKKTAKTVALKNIIIGGVPFTHYTLSNGSFNQTEDEVIVEELSHSDGTSQIANITECAINHLNLNMFGCLDRIREELVEWS